MKNGGTQLEHVKKLLAFAFVLAVLAVLIASFIGCERVQQVIQPTVSQMEER